MIYEFGPITLWVVRVVSDDDWKSNAYPWYYVKLPTLRVLRRRKKIKSIYFHEAIIFSKFIGLSIHL